MNSAAPVYFDHTFFLIPQADKHIPQGHFAVSKGVLDWGIGRSYNFGRYNFANDPWKNLIFPMNQTVQWNMTLFQKEIYTKKTHPFFTEPIFSNHLFCWEE